MAKKHKYTKYTRAHLTLRNLRFWLFWCVLIVLIVLGMIEIHKYFDEKLAQYEAAQYKYVAEETAKIFTEKRFNELYEYEAHKDEEYIETREDYDNYIRELAGNAEIEYTRISSESSHEIRYIVTADGKKFGEFTLEKTGETYTFEVIPLIGYSFGCDIYKPGQIYIDTLRPVTYDYIIPSNASIYVNGNKVGDEYIVGTPQKMFFEGHLPSGQEAYKLVSYRFNCALGTPEISVIGADGRTVALNEIGQDTYAYQFSYSDELLKPQYETGVRNFFETYCKFTSQSTTKAKLTDLILKGSRALDYINNYEKKWITKPSSTEFDNYYTKNYAILPGNALTVEVYGDYICHYNNTKKVNTYSNAMRLYFVKSGNKYVVYDFEMLYDTTSED